MSASRPAVVVLAAGEGTRMKSSLAKVLHPICGAPMLDYVLAAAREIEPEQLVVVVGHRRHQVMRHLGDHHPDVRVVVQDRQGGTGHAVRTAIEAVGLDHGTVMVTYGDTPLLRGETFAALVRQHVAEEAAATALTTVMDDPTGYGRIVRDAAGAFAEIVEEADASPTQRAIREVNSGVYAFEAAMLADSVKRVATNNVKGEEYLTDVVAILRSEGHHVASVRIDNSDEVRGVNDRAQLAQARRVLNGRLLDRWMRSGVTIVDPLTTSVDVDVVIEPDAWIGAGTQLEGRTVVGSGARVGPGSLLRDTAVGAGAAVVHAVCEAAVIGSGVRVEPFTHLPPGTRLGVPGFAPPEPAAGPTPQPPPASGAASASGRPISKGAHQA